MTRKYLYIGIIVLIIYLIIASIILAPAQTKTEWNVTTLKEHFDYVIQERDKTISQKFQSLELAVTKAEQATEKRFEGVNEFRNTLADQQRTFIPRSEYEAGHMELTKRLDEIKTKADKLENIKQSGNIVWAYVLSGIALFTSVINVSLNYNRRNSKP